MKWRTQTADHVSVPWFLYGLFLVLTFGGITDANERNRTWRGTSADWAAQAQWSRGQVALFCILALAGFVVLVCYLASDANETRLEKLEQSKMNSNFRGRGLTPMQKANGLWRDARGRIRS